MPLPDGPMPPDPPSWTDGPARTVLFEAAPLGIAVSRKGAYLRANAAYLKLFGYGQESEILGRPLIDNVVEGERHRARARNELRERTGDGPPFYEIMGLRKDGTAFPMQVHVSAVMLEGGPATLVFVSDISERREMEARLREREEVFRSYVEQSLDIIFTLDAEGVFTFVSPAWERHFGLPVTAVLDKPFAPFVHPEDREASAAYLQRVLASGQAGSSPPYRIRHADGSWRWFVANGTPMAAPGGGQQFMGVAHDITEDRRAESALRESEEQMRIIFEASDAGIMLVSPGGEIHFANRRMGELFGRTGEAMIGLLYPTLLHPSEQSSGDGRMRQLITGGIQSVSVERRYLRADGGEFWGHLSGRRLENPDGSLRALVGIITDITQRRRAEEQQRVLQDQLHQAQKLESLGSLAGGLAHDMNNVLGAILGLASAHRQGVPTGSAVHAAFGTIIKAAERGGAMVKRLLTFARQSPGEERDLDLNAILWEEAHLLERTTLAKVRLVMDLAPDLRPIRGDAGALTHALMNLCVNAVDAMPENGTLTLRTRNVGAAHIEVEVEDTGTGMSREVLERALDPFFTTKEVGKGTGLGLSIAYRTVEAHQGKLEIRSEPGRGTCITMRFPASQGSADGELAGPHESEAPPSTLDVLLVDDDELIQASMAAILDLLGHRATVVGSGEGGLARIEAGFRPDVVILDMNMPGLGGAGTLPRLRALLPAVPVLLATGRADQTAQDLVQAHPHVTLLSKPFGKRELEAHFQRIGVKAPDERR
ncbi:PAS domain-containing sensor histidine kinase [Geothrix sp. 21YS21S-4]|uniref:hybrid sensor histidine kinase/response regulator n=1 Tax=Geothrix sp. 21YS21S-4 TaxID=3068889 RepID=UPI0027B92773|nr:PAS domain-containing sensor histidine kinase [Geothrix sp. 21YS21S-4]